MEIEYTENFWEDKQLAWLTVSAVTLSVSMIVLRLIGLL